MNKKYKATVVIPAYNEGEKIHTVLNSIKKLKENYHVVVVDDGSQDNTHEIAKSAGAEVIKIAENMGKGYACRAGAKKAKSDFIIFMDADFQFDSREIKNFVKLLEKNDFVIGVRKYSDIPMARRFSNRFARMVVNRATGKSFSDVLCGFRGIRKNALDKMNLKENRYEIESEMIIKAARNNLKIIELPVSVSYNGRGMSLKDSIKVSVYQIKYLIRNGKK